MLKLPSQENEWHEVLPGVRVLFRPIGRKAWRAAQRAASKVLKAGVTALGDDPLEEAGDEISYALLYRGIVAWEGVVGEDEQPVEPTLDSLRTVDGEVVLDGHDQPVVDRGTISAFLSDGAVFRACDLAYVMPFIERQREKNASSVSPNGTGEAEMQVPVTANSRAAAAKGSGATPARTKSTTPRRKKGR